MIGLFIIGKNVMGRTSLHSDGNEVKMAYFDAQKGWFHLAFLDEDDYYYMPSLAKLGADDYLRYLMNEAGYQVCLSIVPGEKEPVFIGRNDAGQQFVNDKLGMVKKSLFGKKNATFEEKLEMIFNSEQKTAVVLPLPEYESIFSVEKNCGDLKEALKNRNVFRSIFVVTAPLLADSSNRYLISGNSALCRNDETIWQAAEESRSSECNLYESLKKKLGDRCVFLNRLSQEDIRNAVIRNLQIECTVESAQNTIDCLDAVSDILYAYYYFSQAKKQDMGIDQLGFDRNEGLSIRVLDQDLKNPNLTEKLLRVARDYKKQYIPQLDDKCPVYVKGGRLEQWKQVEQMCSTLHLEDKALWQDIMAVEACLRNLMLRGEGDTHKNEVEFLTTAVRSRLANGNSLTYLPELMQILRSYLEMQYTENKEVQGQVWELCTKILNLVEQTEKVDAEEFEIEKEIQRYRDMKEEQHTDVYDPMMNLLAIQSDGFYKVAQQMREALDLFMKNLKNCRAVESSQIAAYNDSLGDVFLDLSMQLNRERNKNKQLRM